VPPLQEFTMVYVPHVGYLLAVQPWWDSNAQPPDVTNIDGKLSTCLSTFFHFHIFFISSSQIHNNHAYEALLWLCPLRF
jgi:hypothetical protein